MTDALVNGRTVLICKTDPRDSEDPSKYRPIACLNVRYKLLTTWVSDTVGEQIVTNDIITTEQRAMKKGVWGTMDCLMADEVITRWGKLHHKRITTAWIVYQKAFDSIPHKLISWMLNTRIVGMITALIPKWRSEFSIHTSGGTVKTEPITLLRGDTLSVLLF